MIEKNKVIDYIEWLIAEIRKDEREEYPKWMHVQSLLSVIGFVTTEKEEV